MKSPKIYCIFKTERTSLLEYLQNIGALVSNAKDAAIILTDDEANFQKGRICFLIGDKSGAGFIPIAPDTSYQNFYQKILQTYSAFANAYCQPHDVEQSDSEEAIVAGFARHFSHNVLNALLSAGGFLRQLKAQSTDDEQVYVLWKTVDDKLRFIEELVNGYNDYHHVINLKMTDTLDVATYFEKLIIEVSDKTFNKAFSAYLGYQTNNYELTYTIDTALIRNYEKPANPLFLKLAFCYILKDTIRYLHTETTVIKFHVSAKCRADKFMLEILVKNINLQPDIIETMLRPWDHQMFVQSFDYWGVVVAQTIITKHGGKINVLNSEKDLLYVIEL